MVSGYIILIENYPGTRTLLLLQLIVFPVNFLMYFASRLSYYIQENSLLCITFSKGHTYLYHYVSPLIKALRPNIGQSFRHNVTLSQFICLNVKQNSSLSPLKRSKFMESWGLLLNSQLLSIEVVLMGCCKSLFNLNNTKNMSDYYSLVTRNISFIRSRSTKGQVYVKIHGNCF